jgi:hypothetical protein
VGFRKITNKGGVRKFIGKFPSYVHNKIIWYESRLERDFLYHLEFDYRDVLELCEQACRIYYVHQGKRRRFTVDFVVRRRHKNQIIEVKYSKRALQNKFQPAFRAARALGKLKGYEFQVVTERTIRRQPRLDNTKLLIYYQRTPVHPQHQILCSEFLHGREDARLDEMMEFFETRGVEKGGCLRASQVGCSRLSH